MATILWTALFLLIMPDGGVDMKHHMYPFRSLEDCEKYVASTIASQEKPQILIASCFGIIPGEDV